MNNNNTEENSSTTNNNDNVNPSLPKGIMNALKKNLLP